MAQLAIAGAGALLGGALGSAVGYASFGASIGWALGGLAGNMLFGPKPPSIEGPRLGDLTVQTSTYGSPIPIIYGTVRISGNIIWSSGIKETVITRRVRAGKGGGRRQTVTEYQYSASWATAFCEGAIDDVLKIWFDSHLVYDSSGASLERTIPGLTFRIYKGTEDQLPDPLIEQNVGSANVVPFRGLFYIVFDNVPLAQVGNRIPSVSVLVTRNATKVPLQYDIPDSVNPIPNLSPDTLDFCHDPETFYFVYQFVDSNGRTQALRIFDQREERTWDVKIDPSPSLSFGGLDSVACRDDFFVGRENGTFSRRVFCWNIRTGQLIGSFGTTNATMSSSTTTVHASYCNPIIVRVQSVNGPEYYWVSRPASNPMYIIRIPDMTYVVGSGQSTNNVPHVRLFDDFPIGLYQHDCLCYGREGEGFSEAYYIYRNSANLRVRKIKINANAFGNEFSVVNVTANLITDVSLSVIFPTIQNFHLVNFSVSSAAYDATDDSIILVVDAYQITPTLISEARLIKVKNGSIVWNRLLDANYLSNSNPDKIGSNMGSPENRFQFSLIQDKTTLMIFKGIPYPMRATLLSTVDGSILDQQAWSTTPPNIFDTTIGGLGCIIPEQDAVVYNQLNPLKRRKVRWPILSGGGQNLASIVSDLCQKSGLSITDIDVSALSSDTVQGFIVSRPMPARSAIEPLATAYFFDAVERGSAIVFRKRGGSSVATIPFDDLVREGQEPAIEETRAQDGDLFRSIVVRYIDPDRNHDIGTQQWSRPLSPNETMASQQSRILDLPIVMTASEAKTQARRLMLAAWRERTRYRFALPHRYLRLEPTDPITITRADGTTVRCRIISSVFENDWRIRIEASEEDITVYNVTAIADTGTGAVSDTIKSATRPNVFSDNIPLMEASHDANGTGANLYYFAGPYFNNTYTPQRVFHWSGSAFLHIDDLPRDVSWGYVSGEIPQPTSYWTWDRTTELTVRVENGLDNFVTASELEVLNGENVAVLFAQNQVEVIQFQEVVPVTGNVILLRNLLRGRFGTEDAGTFTSGAVIVLYDSLAWRRTLLPSSSVNTAQRLRFAGPGVPWQRGIERAFTFVGRAEQPWAPVHIRGTRNMANDVTITWVRRTRFSGGLVNGTGTVPLNEQSELYDVEIRNPADTATVRSFLNLSSPTVTYTASQQTADGLIPGDPVRVRVWQRSALVGRGRMGSAIV